MSASLNHCKKMGAEPGRRFLKQPAAKLEPVIVVTSIDVCCFTGLHKTFFSEASTNLETFS